MPERELTQRQMEMLDRIVRTNGGGISAGFHEGQADTRIIRALERRGLVQGKSGNSSRAVHTSKGLEFWRANFQPDSNTEATS